MTKQFRPMRRLLAAALALFAAAPAFASDNVFSNTYFFGDSLTDGGFYRPFLVGVQGPNAALVGEWTTNPGLVWSQLLAGYYGTNGDAAWGLTTTGVVMGTGTNYAAGGATFNDGPGFPPSVPTQYAPTIPDQVNAYLYGSGGHADPNALYTVWGGANDLFFHLYGLTTQTQFLSAAGIQVQVVGALQDAGARYILVPNLPDVGITPFGLSQGPAGSAGISALVDAYNDLLFNGLAQAGYRVIPLDTFNFIREIVANPGAYGLVNVTNPACGGTSSLICSPLNLVDPNAPETYAFADSVHPSSAAHRMIAQYAISMIEGPRQVAVLPVSADATGRARADVVYNHVAGVEASDGMRWWGDVRGDFQHSGSGENAYGGSGPALTGGVDWRSGALAYGVFAGIGRQSIDWGHDRGDFRQTDTTLGGFIGWSNAHAWVDGQLSYTNLGFDTHRDVVLGAATRTHDGSPGGSNITAGVQAGWTFGDGALRQGPVIGLLSQTIKVDGFAESDPTLSTSLAYPDQKFDSLIGSLGWQASYAINDHVQPYARVTWDRQFEDAPEEAFAQSQTLSMVGDYAVPGLSQDKSYATLLVGARTRVAGFDANFGVTGTLGQDSADNASAFVTVGRGF